MSSMSRGNSIDLNNCFSSSSTLIGTLGSFGYAISSCESKFDSSQICLPAFRAWNSPSNNNNQLHDCIQGL
ncbi:hypothetical protein Hanom_Chr01g00072441 [Helianthus anomalus]